MPKSNDLTVPERFLSFVKAWLGYERWKDTHSFGEGYLDERCSCCLESDSRWVLKKTQHFQSSFLWNCYFFVNLPQC